MPAASRSYRKVRIAISPRHLHDYARPRNARSQNLLAHGAPRATAAPPRRRPIRAKASCAVPIATLPSRTASILLRARRAWGTMRCRAALWPRDGHRCSRLIAAFCPASGVYRLPGLDRCFCVRRQAAWSYRGTRGVPFRRAPAPQANAPIRVISTASQAALSCASRAGRRREIPA